MTEKLSNKGNTKTVTVTGDEISLNDFCSRLSETVKSVALISAFHHVMTGKGNKLKTPEFYAGEFDKFRKSEVE
ncbi:hypothetical protein [Morganella phage Mecenats66]|nr:hypothetical protein [Morganella phage Mecenats66]